MGCRRNAIQEMRMRLKRARKIGKLHGLENVLRARGRDVSAITKERERIEAIK
jgi:hypothetical protein